MAHARMRALLRRGIRCLTGLMTDRLTRAAAGYDLDSLRRDLEGERGGEVDDSIPELAKADPDAFGVSLAFPDGEVRSTGDAKHEFSLQSAVKPFVYALALEDNYDQTYGAVGVEPTGEAFDAVALEDDTGRPPNPMVNAGALLTASLVDGGSTQGRRDRIIAGLSAFAGRDLWVDEGVSRSEQLLGDRNRALGYLMRSFGTLEVDVDDALEVYAAACSVMVDAEDLALMGATLALGGRNPRTGEQAISRRVVTDVLSVMATCGMYDGSGRWLRKVGLPAKSGVSGGLVAAAQGVVGISVYSPPLDEVGNSVRGVAACERISSDLGLHVFSRRLDPA